MERIPQSATIRVPLQAYLSSDHVSPATGKTIAVTISKNGGAYGNPSAGATNATEIASGSYYVDLSSTDTNTTGPLFILGTATATDPINLIYNVVDANNGGLAYLDAAVTTRTKPADTQAAVTTVTNLTNAPTAGDLTSTMKASVSTACTAATPTVAAVTAPVTIDGTSPLTEAYAAKNGPLTLAKALYGMIQQLGEMGIVGTTMTVKKRDGSTPAKTYTLDSSTAPTSITEAS